MGVSVSTDTARSFSSTAAPAISPRDTWASPSELGAGAGAARPWASNSVNISLARFTTWSGTPASLATSTP